jgi:hypothetical protein
LNNIIEEVKENYRKMEKTIVEELFMTVNNHHLTAGTFREKVWKKLFKNIIPKKFTIEQGAFLIDSGGKVSNETDLVIFDEQYTPYVLKNKNIKFIPIEAAMAVVQCKSNSFQEKKILNWEKSIDELKIGESGLAGSATDKILTNTRETKPIKIICGTFSVTSKKLQEFLEKKSQSMIIICAHSKKTGEKYKEIDKNGNEIEKNIYMKLNNELSIYNKYSNLQQVTEEIVPSIKDKKSELECVNIELCEFEVKNLSLLTLVFQLNQYIMLINNPIFFPHRTYVNMFNKNFNVSKENE